MKSKARLSIKGEPERQTTAVGSPDIAANMSMSTVLCSYLSVLMVITNGRLCYNATFLEHLSRQCLEPVSFTVCSIKIYLKASLFGDTRTEHLQLNFHGRAT